MPKGFHVGWTGREVDAETGMSFHRARYYSPELRRWTQEDPIGYRGGANLYAYVDGRVLEARDPSGLYYVCHAVFAWHDRGANPGGGGGTIQVLEFDHCDWTWVPEGGSGGGSGGPGAGGGGGGGGGEPGAPGGGGTDLPGLPGAPPKPMNGPEAKRKCELAARSEAFRESAEAVTRLTAAAGSSNGIRTAAGPIRSGFEIEFALLLGDNFSIRGGPLLLGFGGGNMPIDPLDASIPGVRALVHSHTNLDPSDADAARAQRGRGLDVYAVTPDGRIAVNTPNGERATCRLKS